MASLVPEKSNNFCVFGVCVASFIQHAKCMHQIILSSMACLALPYFTILSHKWHSLQKKTTEGKKLCFDFSYNSCLKLDILYILCNCLPHISFISNYCLQFLRSTMFWIPTVPTIRELQYCQGTCSITYVSKF